MSRFNVNQILSKLVHTGDRLVGHTANKLHKTTEALKSAKGMGVKGVPEASIKRSERLTQVAKGRSLQTRIKAGVGAAGISTAGFLGLHKYHQHKDNKILERINNMYLSQE